MAITSQESSSRNEKLVRIWTENKQVMTTAVERGWNTFIFTSHNKALATEWASMAMISPLFIEGCLMVSIGGLRRLKSWRLWKS
ncbi:hypothetical protein ACHQM5_030635 [Ranunculus cassubicifolius]